MTDFLHHHAYLVEGDSVDSIRNQLENDGFKIRGNPDFHAIEVESLGVDDSRRISELSIQKPFGERKIIIVCFGSATREAQNALLKTLEDPTPDTHFFLITPSVEALLPTLRSRCEHITLGGREATFSEIPPELFLETAHGRRLDLLEKIIKDGEHDKALVLVDGVEKYLYESKGGLDSDRLLAFTEIARARKYLGSRGSSLKLIFSHLALVLPVINTKGD